METGPKQQAELFIYSFNLISKCFPVHPNGLYSIQLNATAILQSLNVERIGLSQLFIFTSVKRICNLMDLFVHIILSFLLFLILLAQLQSILVQHLLLLKNSIICLIDGFLHLLLNESAVEVICVEELLVEFSSESYDIFGCWLVLLLLLLDSRSFCFLSASH